MDHTSPDPGDAHLWSLLASEPDAVLLTGDRLLLENPRTQNSVISPREWADNFRYGLREEE
jgi:predicted nucleic acid-binding protein